MSSKKYPYWVVQARDNKQQKFETYVSTLSFSGKDDALQEWDRWRGTNHLFDRLRALGLARCVRCRIEVEEK